MFQRSRICLRPGAKVLKSTVTWSELSAMDWRYQAHSRHWSSVHTISHCSWLKSFEYRGFAHETILVEASKLIVGIILHKSLPIRWQVEAGDWATSHQLQRNYRLLPRIRIKCIEADEVTIENHLVATADMRSIGKSIKHIHAVRPCAVRFYPLSWAEQCHQPPVPCICHDIWSDPFAAVTADQAVLHMNLDLFISLYSWNLFLSFISFLGSL